MEVININNNNINLINNIDNNELIKLIKYYNSIRYTLNKNRDILNRYFNNICFNSINLSNITAIIKNIEDISKYRYYILNNKNIDNNILILVFNTLKKDNERIATRLLLIHKNLNKELKAEFIKYFKEIKENKYKFNKKV